MHFRVQTGAFWVPSRLRVPRPGSHSSHFPHGELHASRASFCVQRLLPAARTPGRTVATRNLSQSPLKFSKALRPRLHGGRHPNGKRPRRHRSFLHSVSSPALWGWGEVLRRVALIRGTSHREPPPSSRSARSRGPGRGQPRARVPRSRRNDSGRSGPRRLYGLARPRASLARPGRQGARWLAPPTLSARLDRVRHIGCRSRRGQRFLLCLRCALQVPAA